MLSWFKKSGNLPDEALEGFLLEYHRQHLLADLLRVLYDDDVALSVPTDQIVVWVALSDYPWYLEQQVNLADELGDRLFDEALLEQLH